MDRDRLGELALMVSRSNEFDMGHYVALTTDENGDLVGPSPDWSPLTPEHECGTSGCIAGHELIKRAFEFNVDLTDIDWVNQVKVALGMDTTHFPPDGYFEAAMKSLDLTQKEARWLFTTVLMNAPQEIIAEILYRLAKGEAIFSSELEEWGFVDDDPFYEHAARFLIDTLTGEPVLTVTYDSDRYIVDYELSDGTVDPDEVFDGS